MIVKDFDRQSILSPSEVGALVKRLPKAHVLGLRTILYKPAAEFARLQIPIDLGCKGAFYPEFHAVVIFDLVNKSLAPHILYHEVGHYVFHRVLDSYVKKAWVMEICGQSQPTSDYGKRNPVEDFAESYAVYAQDPRRLTRIPAKHRFMRSKVFC